MRELCVKPELEIYDSGHLEVALQLLEEDLLEEPLQFSLVLGVSGGMAAQPANLVSLVSRVPAGAAWQVIGIGRANLPLTAFRPCDGRQRAHWHGDTLMLRRGVPASGNAELVARLAQLASALEPPPADVPTAAQLLKLDVANPCASSFSASLAFATICSTENRF